MMKIIFIIPFFGRWPFWIDFFLKSCSKNEKYTWLIYSDCDTKISLPKNVIIKPISFENYKKLVAEKLQISFNPDSPYKLCDIKPALGYIHKEDTNGYDFVAFGDIDLVYGNLDIFITPEKLKKFDIISTHIRRISGHLCLMRNEDSVIELFKQVPDWQQLISNSEHRAFDEKVFSRLFMKHKNFPLWLRKLAWKLHTLSRRVSFEEAFSTPYLGVPWMKGEKLPNTWSWNNGKLTTDTNKELAYYHFLHWKKSVWSVLDNKSLIPKNTDLTGNYFSISQSGFSTET